MVGPTKTNALKCLKRAVNGASQVKGSRHGTLAFEQWKTRTIQELKRIFGHASGRPSDFSRSLIIGHGEGTGTNVERAIALLHSWIEEIDEDWTETDRILDTSSDDFGISRRSNKVFVVHGHDEAAKQAVARYLERLGLTPIVLHEQPNQGSTIIEKFESHADVGFAVVLLTPDDMGAPAKEAPRPRARQNVIFELGFFIGRLGRERVCALVKGDVETPSDYDGVAYTKFDDAGGWRMKFVQELKAAGFDVDANRAL